MKKDWGWWVLGPAIFLLTTNPFTGGWKLFMLTGAALLVMVDLTRGRTSQRKLTGIVICGLFLVGATNWFFSPFFFFLYLMSMAVTFVMGPTAGLGFVVSLVGLFVFNVGQVDVTYDSLVLLSLLITYPIAVYLRKEYLNYRKPKRGY